MTFGDGLTMVLTRTSSLSISSSHKPPCCCLNVPSTDLQGTWISSICAWKALCKLESSLGSALSGRDLGLGSWVFPNWRFLISQVEVIERPLPGLCEGS